MRDSGSFPEGAAHSVSYSGPTHRIQARATYLDILPMMKVLRDSGKTLREIAKHLNDTGHVTRQGRAWNPTQVKRVLDRCTLVNQGEGNEVLHQE
jgi:hypothetical protein